MAEGLDVELASLHVEELEQIERRQVAGRVVEEHVFGAGVAGVDAPGLGAGVPVVDRGVELKTRIGALPGRFRDLSPQVARLDGLADLRWVGPPTEMPVFVAVDGLEERL